MKIFGGETRRVMGDNIEEWKSMTAQQLMNKKDSIEEEIKSLHDELENVKLDKGLYYICNLV